MRFQGQRYLTHGVQSSIPLELQLLMWQLVTELQEPKDYLQVFRLSSFNGMQKIIHEQEQPPYSKEYTIKMQELVDAKVYIIDDGEYSTMLLAEEY